MLARCLRLFPPHLSFLTLCCAASLCPALLFVCCVVCCLILLSSSFIKRVSSVYIKKKSHQLILLSNNFFLVFVLEAIIVPGVQSGQEPLLYIKKKSLSFYPWWLSIDVKLLPWMVKHWCVAYAFIVVKHSKIVFCFCLEWLSTMFSFCS